VFDFDPAQVLVQYFCLLFSLCVHEAAHAAMANYCGDPSARLLGRLTLDPRKHIDPLGTVVFPLLAMFTGIPYLFGWAKPVPFNPRNLNNQRRDPVLIAMAGPASNLLIALAVTLLLRFLVLVGGVSETAPLASQALVVICMSMAIINLVLMLFNLIPVPPLDGHYVVRYFLSPEMEAKFEQIGPIGIIFVILFAGKLISVPLSALLGALMHYVQFGLAGIF
jgi:Zn-dependent protease